MHYLNNPTGWNEIMKDRFNIYKSNFFYLLCLLIIYSVASSLFVFHEQNKFFLSILFSLGILSCVYSVTRQTYLAFTTILLGIITLSSHWIITLSHPNSYFYLIFYITNIIFLLITTYFILYAVTLHQKITANSLMGAICGYFLIGFTWSNIYLLIATFDPLAFSHPLLSESIHVSAQQAFYYSFTTMTTLGYGDILPISHIARTCSWLEAVSGQIYLAVWISQLVGLQIAQRN